MCFILLSCFFLHLWTQCFRLFHRSKVRILILFAQCVRDILLWNSPVVTTVHTVLSIQTNVDSTERELSCIDLSVLRSPQSNSFICITSVGIMTHACSLGNSDWVTYWHSHKLELTPARSKLSALLLFCPASFQFKCQCFLPRIQTHCICLFFLHWINPVLRMLNDFSNLPFWKSQCQTAAVSSTINSEWGARAFSVGNEDFSRWESNFSSF